MPTISEQLAQLQQDREDLVDNLETMGISGLSGDETFTELVPEVLNISGGGGADLSDYFYDTVTSTSSTSQNILKYLIKRVKSPLTVTGTHFEYMFHGCTNLEEAPQMDTSNATLMNDMFNGCQKITTIPQYNTSNVTSMDSMLRNCYALTDIPLLDTSSVTQMGSFVNYVNSLTDNSFNNLLLMCANTSQNYSQTKTLNNVCGNQLSSSFDSRIQGLSNYQTFINAGWTIR